MTAADWLTITSGAAPLVVSLPHAGTLLPPDIESRVVSPWLARKDADWWIDSLYGFAAELGATVIHTAISRTVIDVNRDPSGASLYPGQATTGLCPVETFDGEPLYADDDAPTSRDIVERRRRYFMPYHAALSEQLTRLIARHPCVVLYDCHSIRSVIPRLFEGELPHFNLGTSDGASCDWTLTRALERVCDRSGLSRVTNGRFKGGYITRHYGLREAGVHAVQMELACRGYMDEPPVVGPATWPTPYSEARAAALRATLVAVLERALGWAVDGPAGEPSTKGVS
ncbi:MAG: N-formylglutamate deformylase [Acidobacteria bacterium]|nr:N-formylglutamate deformylase [Acidobacteriota bacterium]